MIKDIRHHKFVGTLGKRLFGIAGLIAPVLGIVIDWAGKIDKQKNGTLASILDFIKIHSLYFYLLIIICLIVGYILSRDGKKIQWTTLQSMLDELQEKSYNLNEGDEHDKHRVTLFQYKKWCWRRHGLNFIAWFRSKKNRNIHPMCGWLMPVLRSNHQGKKTKVVFAITDNSDNTEGVVGRCWASNRALEVSRLPGIQTSSSEANCEKYAKGSFLPLNSVLEAKKRGKSLPRSMYAMPITANNGDLWGVVIWDSAKPNGIDVANAREAFKAVMKTISHLTEDL